MPAELQRLRSPDRFYPGATEEDLAETVRAVEALSQTGVWHTAKAVIPHLIRPGTGGSVILTRGSSVRAVSANGVLGDPAGASAADGAARLAELLRELVRMAWARLPGEHA